MHPGKGVKLRVSKKPREQNVLNINQNHRREKKRKKPYPKQNKNTHTKNPKKTPKKQLLLFHEFEDEDAFLQVGIVLRHVLYMLCGYWLCLPISMSQVPCFLQVTLTRQCR